MLERGANDDGQKTPTNSGRTFLRSVGLIIDCNCNLKIAANDSSARRRMSVLILRWSSTVDRIHRWPQRVSIH